MLVVVVLPALDGGGARLRRGGVPAPQRAAVAVRARSRGGRGRPAVPGGDGRTDRATRCSPRCGWSARSIVLVALARLVARSLAVVRSQQWAQQEELAVAALHLERARELAAERDHELRNGLAGLAGITHLLSSGADDERAAAAQAGRAVRAGPAAHDPRRRGCRRPRTPRRARSTRWRPVLAGLVTLRRSAGAPVSLDVEHTRGPAGVRRRRGARPGGHQPARQLRPARPRRAGHRARLPQRGPGRRRGARRGARAAGRARDTRAAARRARSRRAAARGSGCTSAPS